MKIWQAVFFVLIFFSAAHFCRAQNLISGSVQDEQGLTLPGVTILIKGTTQGTSTDMEGNFELKVPAATVVLVFSGIGYETKEMEVNAAVASKKFRITLKDALTQLNAVEVVGESKSSQIEKKGFSVAAIETAEIKTQSVRINAVLNRTAGVRVRSAGGIGSDFEYTLDGMSGNAIRFFIDGIPMDYFGSSYSINNLPVSLIDRIDVYKGVVPVELGSDALGGAINLVTDQNLDNFMEASYSFGSFNTHEVALHGQWRAKSGFTTRLSTFYTYSDNNYKVWGEGVFYGEEGTGRAIEFTKDNPAERFNDDFQTLMGKLDVGFVGKKWADRFFIGLLASDQKKGVQTAQTMAQVFGEFRNNEEVLMPHLSYTKNDLFAKGLDVNAFAGYSDVTTVVVDTTMNRYDWRGQIIGTNPGGGENGRNGRSLFTQKDKSVVTRLNTTYKLPLDFKLGFNYLHSSTRRNGEDPFSPVFRIPFVEPQNIGTHFAGLSLETVQLENRLNANIFVKYYGYNASINDLIFTTEWEII
ncbi:MAG: carboxypeptidase-like regulatory domain-containing protein, partial [Bacteroidota bacterium]